MLPTNSPRALSSRAAVLVTVLLLLPEGSVSYQPLVPRASRSAAFVTSTTTTRQHNTRLCMVGADFDRDFDRDFEAALGQPSHASEYELDAEFYRKRNEVYSKSLRKANDEIAVAKFEASSAISKETAPTSDETTTEDDHESSPRWVQDSISTSQKAARGSFKFVEKTTFAMLYNNPVLALAIFAACGALVAYLSGFFFLEGYIEDWNPAENDMIPYWDDAEIHTIDVGSGDVSS